MRDLLTFLVKSLSEQPENVVIDETRDGATTVFRVKVAQPDMGRVIGKGGKTAKSIRTLVQSVAFKNNQRVNVEFDEEGKAGEVEDDD